MCVVGILGVNLCCWVFYVAICIVGSFRRQCVLLGLLGGNMCLHALSGNVCCWVFDVGMCAVGSFRWQNELVGLFGGNMYCWVF